MKTQIRLKLYSKSGKKLIWSGWYDSDRQARDAERTLKHQRKVPRNARAELKVVQCE